MLVLACVQAAITYRTARAETESLFDAQMQRIALSLSGRLAASELDGPLTEGPAAVQDMIIQIWRADGVMLYRSPTNRLLPLQAVIGFSDVRMAGERWRVYARQTPNQVVQVAQQVEARQQMAGQLALRAVLPVALLAPVLMLIVWWVVGRALAPVERVRRQVAERRPGDLSPLPTAGLPAELRPLVDEMNGLLTRLAAAWDALTHFTADAAHELRSPLAALRLQVQSLQRAPDEAARNLAAERLIGGVDRATRLIEQLLALARQEGAAREAALAPVDLSALARAAVAEALAVLLRNLIENALRYTPAGGQVRVGVQAAESGQGVELVVEDSGPGIAPEDRQRVLDRFYRVPGAPGHGSGLGLAIVQAIAQRHGVALRLDESPALRGARVALRWPG